MRTSALFDAKSIGFFKIYGVSARTRGEGFEPVQTRGGGQFFAILCGRPLWTVPNNLQKIKFIAKVTLLY